jgi:DNA-binding MarR family transcriptional regulator
MLLRLSVNDLNYVWVFLCEALETAGLSKNQKLILKFLEVKPEMTTKELAELVYGKPVEYKTKEYSSVSRSLHSLERRELIKRVQIQLRWKLKTKK